MAELSLTCPAKVTSTGVAGSGISLDEHEQIDSLVHNLSEDTYQEIIRNATGDVSNVNIYTSLGGTLIRSTAVSRDSLGQVASVTENQYDGVGTLVQTLVTNVTRSGEQVAFIETDETELF